MSLHLKYSGNTWCENAKRLLFDFAPSVEAALGVEKHHSLAAWAETRDAVRPLG